MRKKVILNNLRKEINKADGEYYLNENGIIAVKELFRLYEREKSKNKQLEQHFFEQDDKIKEKQEKINEIIEELSTCKKRKIKTSYILEKLEVLYEPTSLELMLLEALLNNH